jgi:hypothetical protein
MPSSRRMDSRRQANYLIRLEDILVLRTADARVMRAEEFKIRFTAAGYEDS